MNLHQSMTDYVAAPRRQTYGVNEPPRIGGLPFNLPAPPVELPPGVTSPLASHPDDPAGERLALGIVRAIEHARAALRALGVPASDTIETAAAHGFASAFSFALRHYVARGRDVPPRPESSWRGAIERGASAFHRGGCDWALVGEQVAREAGILRRPDDAIGILGATLAVLDATGGLKLSAVPGTLTARLGHDRDANGQRLAHGRTYVASELAGAAKRLGADEDTAAAIGTRGQAHYAAGFTCALHVTRRGPSAPDYSEMSGTGIRRAVDRAIEVLGALAPSSTSIDRALVAGDLAEACLRADAGSFESVCGQGMAVLGALPMLLKLNGKGPSQ
jgi:hypothetical protein